MYKHNVAYVFVLLMVGLIFVGAVPVSAEEGTTIFEDDFSALNLDNWSPFGSPSPRVLASVEGRNGVFDNNGDSWCDSGVVSKDTFSFLGGSFTIESDVFVRVTNKAGCWDAAVIGLTKENTPYWDHPLCPGEGYYTGLAFGIFYTGDACWATPPEKRRHAYFSISLYTEDGTGEGPGSYAINADDYINGWHNLKIVVGEDRFVSFYCDDNLIYKSKKRIHEDILLDKKIYLGQRSCGWSAGKAYHDYVKVVCQQKRVDAVYLNYQNINNKKGKLIMMDIKIDKETTHTYYCAFSWTAIGEAVVGYYGIQSEGGSLYPKHVHLTVWDPPDGKETKVISKSEGVECKHVSDEEGNYCVCTWNTDWSENQDYKLIVKVSTNGDSTFYDAYFSDYNIFKHIATLEYPKKDKWIDAVSTFIEDFYRGSCDDPYRSFLVGNGYKELLDGTVVELKTAKYSPIGCCGERNAESQGSWFKLETGKGAVEKTKPGKIIERESTIRITTTSPVDIEVINPEGKKTNKQFSEDPSSKYLEYYIDNDNELDDEVIISVKKIGTYQIKIIPESDAEPTDTYTLKVSSGDTTFILAENVSISDIPTEPYIIESTNTTIIDKTPKAVPTLMWNSSDIGYVRSIVVDDPDDDGTNEIVVGTLTGKGSNDIWHGYIYIFDALTHDLEWNSSDIGYVRKLKVADLNGDGKKDIIASVWYKGYGTGNHYGYIYVFDGLTHEQKWKSDNIGGQTIDLAIVDLDDDGVKEIITGGAHYYSCTIHGHVYVFNGSDFSQKWKSSDINRPHGIIIDDLDDDGVKEIIVGTMITDCAGGAYRGYIYVFNGLDFTQEWRSADIGIPSSFVVNDVDGDGIKELITGVKSTLTTDNGHIYVFDGKTHAQEWKSPNINYPVGLEVIDADKDGTKEIITRTGMGHEGHTGHIYVFDGKTHGQEWKSDNIGVAYDLEVDDLDNDGTNEILTRIRNTSNGSLCTFNGITHEKEWQSSDIGTGTSTVADMDNNGWMEILAGGSTEAYQGYLYIFGVSVPSEEKIFDTGTPSNPYPSIMGTHNGTITPSHNINVSRLYTYPCDGTGGHTESIELYENDTLIASGTWNGYQDDYHNITITPSVTLLAGHTYNYTIITGSYPQIIHAKSKDVIGGTITCTSFVDANGKVYNDWIPAIRLE